MTGEVGVDCLDVVIGNVAEVAPIAPPAMTGGQLIARRTLPFRLGRCRMLVCLDVCTDVRPMSEGYDEEKDDSGISR